MLWRVEGAHESAQGLYPHRGVHERVSGSIWVYALDWDLYLVLQVHTSHHAREDTSIDTLALLAHATQHLARRTHEEDVYDIAWSPDSKYIVSASVDNTVHVWDVARGACYSFRCALQEESATIASHD